MKKAKINPIMGDQKKLKGLKANNDTDENEIKSFIILVIIISILIGAIYGVTELLKKKDNNEETKTVGKINYDRISIGTLLNRPESEYYVMIYNTNDSNAIVYSTLLTQYMSKSSEKDYIKIYYCDLENKINSNYYNVNNDNKSNPDAKKISELDLGDITLIKVKNGKIIKYVEDYNKIESILK